MRCWRRCAPQGEPAVSRALAHAGPAPIEIEMTYRIALL